MENKDTGVKEQRLFLDLFIIREAIEVFQRRYGLFYNVGGRCNELINEEGKIQQELMDFLKEKQLKKGDENE